MRVWLYFSSAATGVLGEAKAQILAQMRKSSTEKLLFANKAWEKNDRTG
jgi:predicted transcriptional regulator